MSTPAGSSDTDTDTDAVGADERLGARRVRPAPARSRAQLRAVPAASRPAAASALQFSETVRRVAELARRGGLNVPVFRSPPRLDGVDRTIRRGRRSTVVAIRREGRPLAAVQADVIDGVVAANGLSGARADRFRRAAWQRLEHVDAPGNRVARPDSAQLRRTGRGPDAASSPPTGPGVAGRPPEGRVA